MGPIDVARHGAAVEGRFLWISIFMYPGYPTNPQPCFSTNLYMAYLAYCTCILRSSLFQRFWECMFSLPGVLSCFLAGWIQRLALKLTMWSSESQNSGWQQIGHVRGREVFIRQLFINEITQPHFICRLAFFFWTILACTFPTFFLCGQTCRPKCPKSWPGGSFPRSVSPIVEEPKTWRLIRGAVVARVDFEGFIA